MTDKRIILLSDGTGNSAAKVWRTNVWRVFELLDLTGSDQVAKYDDGVGSSSFRPLAILGGAFGWGLKRNIIDLYKFTCRNYKPGARIYAFGFSRGAFTIRVLIALILNQGIVPYHSESDLHQRCTAAYRAHRAERFHSVLRLESLFRTFRNVFIRIRDSLLKRSPYDKSHNMQVDSIEFIGLWDTVAAYGLPIDEMTRGISQWIWPLELPRRDLDPRVQRACHASGFRSDEVPHWWNKLLMYAGVLLRRDIFRRWFDVIARIGSKGVAEDFLDPSGNSITLYYGETETVKRDGELFLYVNDVVLPLPWIYDLFYWNNAGEAKITIKRLK
jgi:hypothetical protein